MAEVMRATSLADGVPWVPTADQLRIDMRGMRVSTRPGDIVLAEVDWADRGVAEVDRVVRDDVPMYEVSGHVDPDFRRRGIGAALHAWNVAAGARARERGRAGPAGLDPGRRRGGRGRQHGVADHPRLRARPPVLPHAARPRRSRSPRRRLPDGLEIRPVEPDDHRPIWDAENEAFRDHWGHRAADRARLTTGPTSGRSSTPTCGWSPGTVTRSRASSRTGSGPRRTRRSVSPVAGSSR